VHKPYPISDRNGQNLYPISDQKGSKTIPSGAANAHIAYLREYPPWELFKSQLLLLQVKKLLLIATYFSHTLKVKTQGQKNVEIMGIVHLHVVQPQI